MNFTLDGMPQLSLPELTNGTTVQGESRYPCYINVRVYSNPSMNRLAQNIPVYALTERNGRYIGYSMSKTNTFGNACVLTLCYEKALLLVETDKEVALAAPPEKQHIHVMVLFEILFKKRGIKINDVMDFGSIFGEPGPVYTSAERGICESSTSTNFHFKYHFFGEPDILAENPLAVDYDPNTAWYPTYIRESCFIKVQMKTNIFTSNIVAESWNANTGFWYGTAKSSAKEGLNSQNVKAACVEIRCPAVDDFNSDIPTFINASVSLPNGSVCNLTSMSDELAQKGFLNVTNNGFLGNLTSNSNYGPNVGIFKNKKDPQDIARFSCYTGKNAFESVYEMDPEVGIAVGYTCQ